MPSEPWRFWRTCLRIAAEARTVATPLEPVLLPWSVLKEVGGRSFLIRPGAWVTGWPVAAITSRP